MNMEHSQYNELLSLSFLCSQAAIARYSGWQIAYILWGTCQACCMNLHLTAIRVFARFPLLQRMCFLFPRIPDNPCCAVPVWRPNCIQFCSTNKAWPRTGNGKRLGNRRVSVLPVTTCLSLYDRGAEEPQDMCTPWQHTVWLHC